MQIIRPISGIILICEKKFPQNVGTDGDFGRQLQAPLKRSVVFCKQTM